MKQKILILLSLCLFMLAGCGYKEEITIKSDNTFDGELFLYVPSKGATSEGSVGKEVINNVSYNKYKTSPKADNPNRYKAEYYNKDGAKSTLETIPVFKHKNTIIAKDKFKFVYNEDVSSLDFYEIKVKFPKKVIITNGKLSKDKKTVTFDMKKVKRGSAIYAYTSKKQALSANVGSIKLNGLNKYGHLTKAKTLKVKTKEKIRYIKVNGKKKKSIKIKKEGKYKVQVKTNKNTANFEFYYDKKKPTVNVEELGNGQKRITFSDKGSGVKYALFNSESYIENGFIVTSNYWGDIPVEVCDYAGNITKITIKMDSSKY